MPHPHPTHPLSALLNTEVMAAIVTALRDNNAPALLGLTAVPGIDWNVFPTHLWAAELNSDNTAHAASVAFLSARTDAERQQFWHSLCCRGIDLPSAARATFAAAWSACANQCDNTTPEGTRRRALCRRNEALVAPDPNKMAAALATGPITAEECFDAVLDLGLSGTRSIGPMGTTDARWSFEQQDCIAQLLRAAEPWKRTVARLTMSSLLGVHRHPVLTALLRTENDRRALIAQVDPDRSAAAPARKM